MISQRTLTKKKQLSKLNEKELLLQNRKRMRDLIRRPEESFSCEERAFIEEYSWLHKEMCYNLKARNLRIERSRELFDSESVLAFKLIELAALIRQHAGRTVVYTGAGMSTAASIPDYRGPAGKWTLGERQFSMPEASSARPTLAHMVLVAWVQAGLVSHVVSQNVDALHLRSGLSRDKLSEIHGNLFCEVCIKCGREVLRTFDVSERTAPRRHLTGRKCPSCGCHQLADSIVHFGEKSRDTGEPGIYRWRRVEEIFSSEADPPISLILCLGSSLQVLRHYSILWPNKTRGNHPTAKLVIVNFQWTAKDKKSNIKIHASCDHVLSNVSTLLGILVPSYDPTKDPLKKLSIPLTQDEMSTKTRPDLTFT